MKNTDDTGESLNFAEIKELIELIWEKEFNEFELEHGDLRLRLRKGIGLAVTESSPQVTGANSLVESGARETASALTAPQTASEPAVPAAEEEKLHIITSPIVGTFYRSASPTSEPFVKLGDRVEAGQKLCIIEAMKLMNNIESDAGGTIVKILVENGQPVEYGQPLFGIKL